MVLYDHWDSTSVQVFGFQRTVGKMCFINFFVFLFFVFFVFLFFCFFFYGFDTINDLRVI